MSNFGKIPRFNIQTVVGVEGSDDWSQTIQNAETLEEVSAKITSLMAIHGKYRDTSPGINISVIDREHPDYVAPKFSLARK